MPATELTMNDAPQRGQPKKWTPERIAEEADALKEWIEAFDHGGTNVWLKSFALERGYSPQRNCEWSNPGHDDYHRKR